MSKKPKKSRKEVDPAKLPVLPNDRAEHVRELAGLSSEEIIKLLESLGRVDDSIRVSRRRPVPGKNVSKKVGGKKSEMSIAEAVDYEKSRAEQRKEKENQIKELFDFETDTVPRKEINDEVYPKRLTPKDIARSIEAAREQLIELDRIRADRRKIFSPTEEAVLDVLEKIKKQEAARIARYIAERQRNTVLGKTMEQLEEDRDARIRRLKGDPEPIDETPEEKVEREQREEEEKQEAIRSLPGFGKHVKTLVDEAGELTGENVDAAAAVVRQWIGNRSLVENNQ